MFFVLSGFVYDPVKQTKRDYIKGRMECLPHLCGRAWRSVVRDLPDERAIRIPGQKIEARPVPGGKGVNEDLRISDAVVVCIWIAVSYGKRHHAAARRMASGVCSADAGDDCLFGGGISCDCCADHMGGEKVMALEQIKGKPQEITARFVSSIAKN